MEYVFNTQPDTIYLCYIYVPQSGTFIIPSNNKR